jgi:hypothetical protein
VEPPSRYQAYGWAAPTPAAGWSLTTLVEASRLFGSNGMRVDGGGRLWITQAAGNQISTYHPATGRIRVEAPVGIVGHPFEIAFDQRGIA